ncbi:MULTISPECIES: STAS domain-containing protein [unclassified Desulfovibrio]|uniref:STAS domain-containing protein n=1 Tax=unclassified Desulfovibrio TaxID=2593640 RepID=UPI000F602283|nr:MULTISPECIES: STAS domain-containing protein [unclassified Desulfovibrio]RRD71567.1 anti-sigma factor antagonist [Desulfovibrio sp. OH1209_COT-279]RRD87812.1 anti-sigma factor antagonist [Desulfovibrio sp. OH1186_COT-070]
MFTLQAEPHKNATVLRLTGDVLLPDVGQFSTSLEGFLLAPHIRQVVLDLSNTGKMDNSGLGVLISASTRARAHGRRLVLLMPAPHIAELLRSTKIEGFFPTFDSDEELKGYIPDVAE